MYKAKLWDEDKWNIHSSSYNSSKYSASSDEKKDKAYNEQKYGQKEKNVSSDYMKKEEEREKDDKEKSTIFDDIEEQKTENKDIKEDEIPFKAARQIFDESRHEPKKAENKKNIKTIEEAIKKAIEEEKKVIMMD